MRSEAEIRKLIMIARKQAEISRAADLWRGIEDAAQWILGISNPMIDIWIEITPPDYIDVELPEPAGES